MKKLFFVLVLITGSSAMAYDYYSSNSDDNEYKYQGSSGANYKYDLSDIADRLDYSVDLEAQMNDSIDVRIGLDKGFGEYGGGIQEE